jgi:hypothetical protein
LYSLVVDDEHGREYKQLEEKGDKKDKKPQARKGYDGYTNPNTRREIAKMNYSVHISVEGAVSILVNGSGVSAKDTGPFVLWYSGAMFAMALKLTGGLPPGVMKPPGRGTPGEE